MNTQGHVELPGAIEPLLTPDEVCAWLRITKDLLYDLVQAGQLPFFRVGGRQLRFRRSDLESYISRNGNPPVV